MEYWVIKTGAVSHIKAFLKFTNCQNISGKKMFLDNSSNKDFPEVICEDHTFKAGKNAFSQMIVGWEALGLIIDDNGQFVINCSLDNIDDVIEYSKIFLLKKSSNERVAKYRFSKIINSLIDGKYITFSDLRKKGINQKKGTLTKEKILKEISIYEKKLSMDTYTLEKMKEVLNAY